MHSVEDDLASTGIEELKSACPGSWILAKPSGQFLNGNDYSYALAA